MLKNSHIIFVGCGHMGSAMLQGFLAAGIAKNRISIIEPHHTDAIEQKHNIKAYQTVDDLPPIASPILLCFAVKPQILGQIISDYAPLCSKGNTTIFSIIAGKNTEFFKQYLGAKTPIIRTMPNLPVTLGKGVIGAYATKEVTALKEIEELCSKLGSFLWVEEAQIDAITAISGSGPAYFFQFTENLMQAAQKLGFDTQQAEQLARQTLIGSAAMVEHNKEALPTLRQNVTSKGGTTEAALNVFQHNNALEELAKKATKAAYSRAKDLSS